MAVVTHAKVVTVPDDGTSPVGTDEWNAPHIGLENVDNTSDVNKPVSTAQAAAIALVAASLFDTRAAAVAANVPAPINAFRIAGFYAAGDGGASLYKRVTALAASAIGFQSADGAWWQLSESILNLTMAGAKGDTRIITGAVSIASGAGALTVTGAGFTGADVGKVIVIPGAGAAGNPLISSISGFTSSTQLTLNVNASTTLAAVSEQVICGSDDTAPIQAAINLAQLGHQELIIPPLIFTTTLALNVTDALRLRGVGVESYPDTTQHIGAGSWLHLAHLGRGIYVNGAISGVELVGFGTFRDQPAPKVGWAPVTTLYDIDTNQADVFIDDLMLLNATFGLQVNGGRITVGTLRGSPFNVGVNLVAVADTCRLGNIHWWQFWVQDTNLTNYTAANLVGIWLQRVDGPWIDKYLTLWPFNGIKISQNGSGTTSLMHVNSIGIDGLGAGVVPGATAILVDATNTGSVSGTFTNVYVTSSGANYGVNVLGTNTVFQFANLTMTGIATAGVNVAAGSNFLAFTGLDIQGTGNGVVVGAGSTVDIAGNPRFNITGTPYSGAGTINTTFAQNAAQKALGNYSFGGGSVTSTATFNTSVGLQALNSVTSGGSNIAAGVNALFDLTAGGFNTGVGFNTGRGITTGSNNTILGANVGGLAAGLSGAIILADGAGNIRSDYGLTTAATWTISGAFSVTGKVSSGVGMTVSAPMTTGWTFASNAAPLGPIAASSSSADFGTGLGLIVVRENTFDGGAAVFLVGGGNTTLLAQTTAVWGTTGAAGTTTPAASKCSVAYSGTGYRIYNGSTAGARTFYASGFAGTNQTN